MASREAELPGRGKSPAWSRIGLHLWRVRLEHEEGVGRHDQIQMAMQAQIPFRAVVADSFYGEDRGVKRGLRELGVGSVLALKPSHEWWHPVKAIGSFQEAARAAR